MINSASDWIFIFKTPSDRSFTVNTLLDADNDIGPYLAVSIPASAGYVNAAEFATAAFFMEQPR